MAMSRLAESFSRHVRSEQLDWHAILNERSGELSEGLQIVASSLFENLHSEFTDAFLLTESPIEQTMFLALWATGLRRRNVFFKCSKWLDGEIRGVGRMDVPHFIITPQHRIGAYRVDFFVEFNNYEAMYDPNLERKFRSKLVSTSTLIVECDGHEFHEKTKEQAQKDKSRDRELKKLDYKVFHYTGSEIWNDAFKCASEVLEDLERSAVTA